ncbi:MAG: zinc ABC transporter substrate-binding protein, partial [Dehalococcoidales bacterium]|nr:zinc ABC transporter substrate-binding protein [Dehalococcoidales bacterium]
MKKFLSIIITLTLAMSLCACGAAKTKTAEKDGPVKIVVTTFPLYSWAKTILGENPAGIELLLLMNSGVDLHNFQPTPEDIITVTSADVFVYIGGESDEWVDDIASSVGFGDTKVVKLMDAMGNAAKIEEALPGMQEDEEEEEEEYDEHIWLSVKNAVFLSDVIASAIERVDPANNELYASNEEAFKQELKALDKEYTETVQKSKKSVLLFGDRFPFRYLADNYGLTCYAAFSGCSAETEASFETIAYLAGVLDSEDLSYVMTLEGSDGKIARTIIETSEKREA